MKKASVGIGLVFVLLTTHLMAQSGSSKPGSSSGLQQSNKSGATSGGPSGGAGNIGRQRGATSKEAPMSSTRSSSRKTAAQGSKAGKP